MSGGVEEIEIDESKAIDSGAPIVPHLGRDGFESDDASLESLANPQNQAAIEGQRREAIEGVTRAAIETPFRPAIAGTHGSVVVKESHSIQIYPSGALINSLDLGGASQPVGKRVRRTQDSSHRTRPQIEYHSDDDESDERKRRIAGTRDNLKQQYLLKVEEIGRLKEQFKHYTTKQKAELTKKHKEELAQLKQTVEDSNRQKQVLQQRYVEAEELAAGYFWEGNQLKATAESHFARLVANLKASEEEKTDIKKQFEDYKIQIKNRYRSRLKRQEELADLEIRKLQTTSEHNCKVTAELDAAYRTSQTAESRWHQEALTKEGEISRLIAQNRVLIKTNSDWTSQYKILQEQYFFVIIALKCLRNNMCSNSIDIQEFYIETDRRYFIFSLFIPVCSSKG